jgi:hypothetical protein
MGVVIVVDEAEDRREETSAATLRGGIARDAVSRACVLRRLLHPPPVRTGFVAGRTRVTAM